MRALACLAVALACATLAAAVGVPSNESPLSSSKPESWSDQESARLWQDVVRFNTPHLQIFGRKRGHTINCRFVGSLPTLWQEKVVDYLTKAADICGREHCQIVLDLTDLTHLLPRVADFIFPQYLAKATAANVNTFFLVDNDNASVNEAIEHIKKLQSRYPGVEIRYADQPDESHSA